MESFWLQSISKFFYIDKHMQGLGLFNLHIQVDLLTTISIFCRPVTNGQ
jgi:hypothetical protein